MDPEVPGTLTDKGSALDLFELAPAAMVLCHRQGFVLKFNRAFARLVGWQDGKIPPARQFKELLTRPSQYIYGSQVVPPLHLLGAVEEIELDIVTADGSKLPVLLGAVQIDGGDGENLHCFSLTPVKGRRAYAREQFEARAKLERQQEYLDLAEKLARVGHWHAQLATGEVFWSPVVYSIHGRDPADAAPLDLEKAINYYHADDREAVRAAITEAMDSKQPFAFEKRLAPSEHQGVRYVEAYGLCEFDNTGQPTGIFGVLRDVTEARQAQADLEASEERYRMLADSVPGLIGYWDRDLCCRFANQAYQEWTPYAPAELVGMTMAQVAGEELFARNQPYVVAALGGERQSFERTVVIPTGETRHAWIEYLPDHGPDGTVRGFYSMITDVTALKQRDQAEQESNALQSAVLSSTSYIVIATKPDGTVTMFNAAAEAALGYRAEDVIGKHTPGLWHDVSEVIERTEQINAELETAIEPGFATFIAQADRTGSETRGWTYIAKDGRRFPVRLSVTQLRDTDEQITGYLGVVEDITDRKAAEEALRTSEETFRVAMEHASIGMTVLDPGGRWVRVNQALTQLLGYTEEQLLGLDFIAVTHPDDRVASEQVVQQLLSGEIDTHTAEKRYLCRDGQSVWAQLSAAAVRNPDGSTKYLVAQIQDITERREVERVKNELISTVSHELRTPVTSIRGALGLLAGTMANDLSPQAVKLVDIANKNSERLILLVNDMLDIDKIASGKMAFDLRSEALGPIIGMALENNQPYADRFGVSINTNAEELSVEVLVDPARLQQVMSNLLSNAAKFSPAGGQVDVTVTAGDTMCRVAVRDYGQGISTAFAPLIFGKFTQADSSATRSKYGSGLGLHISREIILQMGGQIGFDSTPGEGATFWIDLPLAVA